MDAGGTCWYFSGMKSEPLLLVPFREVRHDRPDDCVHYEPVAVRGEEMDWTIPAHRHEGLHQFQLLARGTAQGTVDGRSFEGAAPLLLMIAPGCVGMVAHPLAAIALLAIGGFAHQIISVLINTLSADVFPKTDIAKANGLVGIAGWTGGLLFSLAIGQLADRIGFPPLFACLGLFDLLGVAWLFAMRRHLILQKA